MSRKKGWRKAVCLGLVLSILLGFGGCTMLLQNVRQQKNQEQLTDTGSQNEVADNKTADASESENGATQPSKVEEALMSDYFVSKMELLEYLVDQYYMSEISVEDMRTGAYKGLLEGLGDPYTCYYTPEEYQDLMESTTGTYYGIGAVVQQNTKTMYITIVKPYVDGPAYNAGMLPGDIIYMVDGVDVSGMEIDKAYRLCFGTFHLLLLPLDYAIRHIEQLVAAIRFT